MKNKLILAATLFLSISVAQAAKLDGAPTGPCEGLKVATGPAGKGYSKLLGDIKRVAPGSMELCEVNTEGGLDNLTTLSIKKADVGIVPMDALKQMAAGDENIANLQVVATLNSNYLHIITAANGVTFAGEKKYGMFEGPKKTVRITKLSDLRGQPVALVGSAQLMVRQLDKTLGLNMRYIDVGSDADGIKMVQTGKVMASFTVAGWPHGALTKLQQNSGVTLVPFDMNHNGPYSVRPYSYKNLGVYNVSALSVQNVLVTRKFVGNKVNDVIAFKGLIAKSLPELQDGDFEPGWNEIKSLDGNVDWQKLAVKK